jgi:hypothetical protein
MMTTRLLSVIAVFMIGFCFARVQDPKAAVADSSDNIVAGSFEHWRNTTEERIAALEEMVEAAGGKVRLVSLDDKKTSKAVEQMKAKATAGVDLGEITDDPIVEEAPKVVAQPPAAPTANYGSTGSRAVSSGGSTGFSGYRSTYSSGYGSTDYAATYSTNYGSTGYSAVQYSTPRVVSTTYSTPTSTYSQNVRYTGPVRGAVRGIISRLPIIRRFANRNVSQFQSYQPAGYSVPYYNAAYGSGGCVDCDCGCNNGGVDDLSDDNIVSPYSTVSSGVTYSAPRASRRTFCNQATGQCYVIE